MRITNEAREEGEAKYPKGQLVRNKIRTPNKPLLLLYLLDSETSCIEYPLDSNDLPFVGYAISFPKSTQEANVSYAVNEELLEEFQNQAEADDLDDYEE